MTAALRALKEARCAFRVVVDTPSFAGQLAAAESGVAIAAIARRSVPASLEILGERAGLPPLPSMEVALLRSPASKGDAAVEALQAEMLRVLRRRA